MKYHIRVGGELVCITSEDCSEEKAEDIRVMFRAVYPNETATKRRKLK